MSTRRLILTALVCGLLILVAGGAQLVRISRSDRQVEVLTEGTKAIVGGRPATVESSHATVDKLFVRVRVDYPDRDTALAAPAGYLAWALLAEGRIVEPLADETTCGAPLGPDDPWTVSCDLVYPATKGTKTLAFRSGDAQRLWRISA